MQLPASEQLHASGIACAVHYSFRTASRTFSEPCRSSPYDAFGPTHEALTCHSCCIGRFSSREAEWD